LRQKLISPFLDFSKGKFFEEDPYEYKNLQNTHFPRKNQTKNFFLFWEVLEEELKIGSFFETKIPVGKTSENQEICVKSINQASANA
jgi:hypothetical protein